MIERVSHLIFLLTSDKRMMDTFHSNNLNSPAWFRTSPGTYGTATSRTVSHHWRLYHHLPHSPNVVFPAPEPLVPIPCPTPPR